MSVQRPQIDADGDAQTNRPAGFAALARRMARRTTDLLAIAIVAVGLLAVAGKLSDWWRTGAEDLAPVVVSNADDVAWGIDGTPTRIRAGLGEQTLRRQTVAGSRAEAIQPLLTECQAIVQQSSAPTRPLDDAERALLRELGELQPVERQPGLWSIYRVDHPMTMIIGTRRFDESDAAGAWRVVYWSIAHPAGENAWTLFSLTSPPSSTETTLNLPDGSRHVLSLEEEQGGRMTVFAGTGGPAAWRSHFDRAFPGHRRFGDWTKSGDVWSAVYLAEGDSPKRIDVQIQEDGTAKLTGIIRVTRDER
ncbi:MAG: hypothetical protein ACREJB_10140 [Planctomycetaceae bacterium]